MLFFFFVRFIRVLSNGTQAAYLSSANQAAGSESSPHHIALSVGCIDQWQTQIADVKSQQFHRSLDGNRVDSHR